MLVGVEGSTESAEGEMATASATYTTQHAARTIFYYFELYHRKGGIYF